MVTQYISLVQAASGARRQSYAPYSNFAVGAAVQCKSGTVFVGSNIENVSYGLAICAERIAIGGAVAGGEAGIVAVGVGVATNRTVAAFRARPPFPAVIFPRLRILCATLREG